MVTKPGLPVKPTQTDKQTQYRMSLEDYAATGAARLGNPLPRTAIERAPTVALRVIRAGAQVKRGMLGDAMVRGVMREVHG